MKEKLQKFGGADTPAISIYGKTGKHPTAGRMSDTLIRAAARALNPDRPIMTLASLARGRRSTAKSWATGHRRPPLAVLKILRAWLGDRQAVLFRLIPELDRVIMQREYEPRRRTGFNEIRVREPGGLPRDGRNRRGRPRRGQCHDHLEDCRGRDPNFRRLR